MIMSRPRSTDVRLRLECPVVDDPPTEACGRATVEKSAPFHGLGRPDAVDMAAHTVDADGTISCPLSDTESPEFSVVPVLPDNLVELEGWLAAILSKAHPDGLFATIAQVENIASRRFPSGAVVDALRRVLSLELTRD